GTDRIPDASETSREAAAKIAGVLDLFETVCAREEAELGRIDAIAGDGDHGQGMAYGSKGAAVAARTALEAGAGARTLLLRAGDAWAESAGGTSGALWGAALTAAGSVFDDGSGSEQSTIVQALDAAVDAVQRLGGADVGDKTMIDAAVPFRKGTAASIMVLSPTSAPPRRWTASTAASRACTMVDCSLPDPSSKTLPAAVRAAPHSAPEVPPADSAQASPARSRSVRAPAPASRAVLAATAAPLEP